MLFYFVGFLARYAKFAPTKISRYTVCIVMYCNVLLKLKMICIHCNVLLKLKMICMLILPSTILISVKRQYNQGASLHYSTQSTFHHIPAYMHMCKILFYKQYYCPIQVVGCLYPHTGTCKFCDPDTSISTLFSFSYNIAGNLAGN